LSTTEAAAQIAEIAADGVADGMHIVGEEALAAEKAVRGLERVQLGYLALGVAVGGAIGGFVAFRFAYSKAETKYSQIAADEIAEMRDHYNNKALALENRVERTSLTELVKEQGYSSEDERSVDPPMAVTPPAAVVESATEEPDEVVEAETVSDNGEVRNVFREAEVVDTWDDHRERQKRSPLKPYVIHRDERDEQNAYDEVTFTYYEEDDVLCNELDEIVATGDRERLLGEKNLERFGHGSGDASIVYIRNDQLEMDFEVVRSPNSYAEEVHGLEPEIRHADRRHRGKARFDDE
jgi:hypothetical protein